MIRNETEYQATQALLVEQQAGLSGYKARLESSGATEEEIQRSLEPTESFHRQLKEDVDSYERLERGGGGAPANRNGLGQLLISLRVSQGLTQRELANRISVEESRVSRDERNEYFGITLDRATKILEALNVKIFPI